MSDTKNMSETNSAVIERLASVLGVKDEARRKWRERGRVDYRWRLPLIEAARATGQNLDAAAFDQFTESGAAPVHNGTDG